VSSVPIPGRVQELARMLAGQEQSRSARAHAKELLAGARAEQS
jgi:DNA repair protein RecN (Recombination protein N)